MIRRLHLVRFKNFEDAELSMGPLTLLVGANASGKSNVREALRFLHGIGRGYTLGEIFGGKSIAGWEGLRGGVREVSFRKAESIAIDLEFGTHYAGFESETREEATAEYKYSVEVSVERPRIARESLYWRIDGSKESLLCYDSHPSHDLSRQDDPARIEVRILKIEGETSGDVRTYRTDRAVLTQIVESGVPAMLAGKNGSEEMPVTRLIPEVHDTQEVLAAMRFIDLIPDAMREPSIPGQTMLSDRGGNLSSVLQTLCASEQTKAQLIHWVRALTPMDVADFQFVADVRGYVLLMLVEKDGTTLSAYSASDGTLRFLGLLAALLSPVPGLVFLEEIENGLHPSRLRLLVDLLHSRAREGGVQVVATTHSPTLLALLDEDLLQHVSLVYRLEGEPSGRIQRILDIPDAARVLASHDRAGLLASGWFENIVEFASVPSEPVKAPSGNGDSVS
jgi:predicted ATPase